MTWFYSVIWLFFRIFDRAELQWSWCAFKLNLCGVAKDLLILTLCNYDVLICCGATMYNMFEYERSLHQELSILKELRFRNFKSSAQELRVLASGIVQELKCGIEELTFTVLLLTTLSRSWSELYILLRYIFIIKCFPPWTSKQKMDDFLSCPIRHGEAKWNHTSEKVRVQAHDPRVDDHEHPPTLGSTCHSAASTSGWLASNLSKFSPRKWPICEVG